MSIDDTNHDDTEETTTIPAPDLARDVRDEPARRPVSIPHLVMGLVFLGIAGSWGLQEAGVIGSVEVQWVLPLILVTAGAVGLLVSLTRAGKGVARPSSGA